jgi:polysaccharide biosynthesis protein PslJ
VAESAAPRAPRSGGLETTLKAAAAAAALIALAAAAAGVHPIWIAGPAAMLLVFAAIQRWLLAWSTLGALVIATMLFIPMKRYTFVPGSLPFQLEPYRLLIAFIALGWIGTMLIDPAMRIRRTAFDAPIAAVALTVFASVAVNASRVDALGLTQEIVKKLTFLASFILVVYLFSSTITSRREVDLLVRVLVIAACIVSALGLYEWRTGYNIFNHWHTIFPPLRFDGSILLSTDDEARGGSTRVLASGEHPIALGAVLAMIMPLAIYMAQRTAQRRWMGAAVLLGLGVVATVSRTGIVMLVVILIAYAFLRPAATLRAVPYLLPLLLAAHVAVPGAIGGLKNAFFPTGGIVAEQQAQAGELGSGRLADLGPGLREARRTPLLGQGYGTRITDFGDPRRNAPVLDDQWLGSLLETGVLGVLALGWLLARVVRRLGRFARRDKTAHGWLLAGLAASTAAFAVGMVTFDSFGFYQVTLLLFVLLGIAAAALRPEPTDPPAD